MIPKTYIAKWQEYAPWKEFAQDGVLNYDSLEDFSENQRLGAEQEHIK